MAEKRKWNLPITIGIFFLVIPLAFLFFKTAFHAGPPVQSQMAVKDLAAYNDYVNRSAGYLNSNQPEKSLELLNKAKELNPNSAIVYNNLGVAHIMLKRYDEGIAACRKAIELNPSFQLAKNNLNWGMAEKEKLKKK